MAIIIPSNWNTLEFPNVRSDLILLLRELCDVDYQTKINSNDPYKQFDIDEVFHFFFDDTNLFEDPKSCIGEFLFDHHEVEILNSITKTLSVIHSELGDKDRFSYMAHPLWKKVVVYSGIVLAEFEKKGTPAFTNN